MICKRCNHKLPIDSEFCQYCGEKIDNNLSVKNDISKEDTLDLFLKMQAEETIETMKKNQESQPNNEGDSDFGVVPEKPVFTLATMSVRGEQEYLDKLYTANGEKIKYNRVGSVSVSGINGMIDIYKTYLPSGMFYKTIYINMYGATQSQIAPAGFIIKDANVNSSKSEIEKSLRNKYCKNCGAVINRQTKVCTGCGKQYFQTSRFFKSWILVGALIAAIIILIVLLVDRQQIIANKDRWKEEVFELREKNSELKDKNNEYYKIVKFVDEYAAFVEDDSTNVYHKYECDLFKGKSFWIYNVNAAEQKGYTPCQICH